MPNTTSTDSESQMARFGAAVKRAREERDISQTDFAELCNITTRHLRNIELGRAKASNRLYLRIAKHLGLDAEPVLRGAA
jgi:transcriptional regulator with XRE-family HTH domain